MRSFYFKVFILMVSLIIDLYSGAWTQRKGGAFVSLYYYLYYTDRYFDDNSKIRPFDHGGDFYSNNLGLYLEYGLSDNLNFVLNQPLILSRWSDVNSYAKNFGFGDGEVGLRVRLFQRSFVTSFQFNFIYPFLYDSNKEPRLGYGITGIEGKLLFGGNIFLGRTKSVFGVEIGYRKYNGDVFDQIRYILAYSIYVTKVLQFYLQIDGVNSVRSGLFSSSLNPLLSKGMVELKVAPAIVYEVSYYVYLHSGFYVDIYGRNLSQGKGFFISLWFQF